MPNLSQAPKNDSNNKRNLSGLGLAMLSIIVTLFLLEFFLRVTRCQLPVGMNIVPVQWSQTVGVTNWPGFVGLYTKEGRSCYTINAEGWRDIEHNQEKPAGVYRIAVIGDSYVEALQVELENTFWNRLKIDLQQQGQNVEVLAFGMSGFDSAQAYETLRYHAIHYAPDLVIFMFVPGNDLQDAVRTIIDIPWKSYYTIDESGNLVQDRSFESFLEQQRLVSAYRRIRNSSLVLLYTEQGLRNILSTLREPKDVEIDATPTYIPEAGLSGDIYSDPEPGSDYDQAWLVTEKLFLTMDEFSRWHRANFMIVGVTSGDILYTRATTAYADPFYPEKRVEDFCEQHRVVSEVL